MRHKVVWIKAIAHKVAIFDPLKRSWGGVLIALFAGAGGAIWATSNGIDIFRDGTTLNDYVTKTAVFSMLILALPACLFGMVVGFFHHGEDRLTAAYDDKTLPVWIRRYAATQMVAMLSARGADAWVNIWKEHIENLKKKKG